MLLVADVAEGDQVLSLLDIGTGEETPVPHARPTGFKSVRWAKDGTHLLGSSDCGGEFMALCRIDPASGVVTTVVSVLEADVEAWALSPDGAVLALVENDRGWSRLVVGPAGRHGRR